jgi:peptide/nickel transport system substrate-binding protein
MPENPLNANLAEFCDRRVDAMVEQATAVPAEDPPRASVLWPKVEAAILDRAPVVPFWNQRSADFVSKRLGNYQYSPQFGFLPSQAWVQ